MIILKAHKYRLRVRPRHVPMLNQFVGCQRWVWNRFLQVQKERLDQGLLILSYAETTRELTQLKKSEEFAFLKEVPSQSLQQTLRDLDRALRDYFKKKKAFPRFKKKGCHDSFRCPQGFRVESNALLLPKLGWIAFFSNASLPTKLSNVTVSRRGKHWYASIQYELEKPEPTHPSATRVGIDMGITRFATLSTGEYLEPLNSFQRLERKLAREQRKLSRKTKGSNNWRKHKFRVQAVHIQIADARNDYLHKASTKISKNHAMIVMEDLKVSQMSSSEPKSGSKTRKRKLNRKILDQGWYEFRRQLEYKQLWRGGQVLFVDPANTSRTCPKCLHISKENRKTQARFACQKCGFAENADLVAAYNILMAVGHTVSACGEIKPNAA